jgi:hypothetical protein
LPTRKVVLILLYYTFNYTRRLLKIILTLNPFIIITLLNIKFRVYSPLRLYKAFSKIRILLLIINKPEVLALIMSLIIRLKLLKTSLLILLIK